MRKRGVLVLVLLVVLLASCQFFQTSWIGEKMEVEEEATDAEVVWVEVNPPPNVTGPCYVFFQRESAGSLGFGYAGVVCPNMCGQ